MAQFLELIWRLLLILYVAKKCFDRMIYPSSLFYFLQLFLGLRGFKGLKFFIAFRLAKGNSLLHFDNKNKTFF